MLTTPPPPHNDNGSNNSTITIGSNNNSGSNNSTTTTGSTTTMAVIAMTTETRDASVSRALGMFFFHLLLYLWLFTVNYRNHHLLPPTTTTATPNWVFIYINSTMASPWGYIYICFDNACPPSRGCIFIYFDDQHSWKVPERWNKSRLSIFFVFFFCQLKFYLLDFKRDWGAKGRETAEEGDDSRGRRQRQRKETTAEEGDDGRGRRRRQGLETHLRLKPGTVFGNKLANLVSLMRNFWIFLIQYYVTLVKNTKTLIVSGIRDRPSPSLLLDNPLASRKKSTRATLDSIIHTPVLPLYYVDSDGDFSPAQSTRGDAEAIEGDLITLFYVAFHKFITANEGAVPIDFCNFFAASV